ncbi:glycosylphosphatidylinositol anchor biosynthesis [Didymella keratinophila]|nr:glycosylphosphatidylinositol anchor biosynthesis [Didymella keratinophila]
MPSASDSAHATTAARTGAPPKKPSTSYRDSTLSVFALLLAFRIVNALTLRTFFQPDEFFQSLEPAWQLAFGGASNAWITWLRSSLHPELFAAAYRVATLLAEFCGMSLPIKAELLLSTPKVVQAVSAALLDYYTWKLAEKVYGCSSRTALITPVAVVLFNPLRLSLLLAAFACVLRPTNVLVWLPVAVPTLWQAPKRLRYILIREAILCGPAVLGLSVLSDRAYYGIWTLPPLRFLYFNIAQSLAVFYGRNRPDYYLTEGLPLLLTTALPFAAVGLWQALRVSTSTGDAPPPNHGILSRLAWTSIAMPLTLSLISHKEVRFLYPILPFLHILSARSLSNFLSPHARPSRRAVVGLLLFLNITIAGYASQVHQRGVIDVLHYIRHKHESRNNPSSHTISSPPATVLNTTVGFLMPCHSTPWRSHLVYPEINAWALTCEPPINIPLSERVTYLDEADEFYINPGPKRWLRDNMESINTITSSGSRSAQFLASQDPKFRAKYRRAWPQNLESFKRFPSLDEEMREMAGS